MLPPKLNRSDFKTVGEYQEYLDIEAADLDVSVKYKETWETAASNTIKVIASEKVPITIRLSKRDLQRAKSLALQQGIPYQTLINSIIHRYLDNNF